LAGKQAVSFAGDLYGGSADGVFARHEGGQSIELDVSKIRLELLPLGGENWSLDLAGLGTLAADLDLSTEELSESSGKGELKFRDLEMVAGSVFGFDLPDNATFEQALIRFKIEKGKVELTEGIISGELLEVKIDGAITLSSRGFFRSRPRLDVELTPNESLDSLLKLAPGMRDARQENGTYKYVVTGTIENPRFRADRARNTRTTRSRRVGTTAEDSDEAESDDESDEEGAEERREARRDRLQERREKMRERRDERQRSASDAEDDFDDDDDEDEDDDEDDDEEDDYRLDIDPIEVDEDEDFEEGPSIDVDYEYDD
jgi:hypothetical protein